METKSCSKSFQTFAVDINRALGGKSLQTFATFCHGQKLRQKLSGGTSANHIAGQISPVKPGIHLKPSRTVTY